MAQSRKPSPKTNAELLTGSLQPEYRRCGKASCHCAQGTLHGPYIRRNYWQDGKRHRQYVRLAGVQTAGDATARWRIEREIHWTLMRQVREVHARFRTLRHLARTRFDL